MPQRKRTTDKHANKVEQPAPPASVPTESLATPPPLVPPPSASPSEPLPSKPTVRRARLVPLLIIVGGIIFLSVVAVIDSFYLLKRTPDIAVRAAGWLHLPIAKINGTFISSGDFASVRKTLQTFANYQATQSNSSFQRPSDSVISEVALDRLIQTTLLEQLAEKRNIQVTPADVDTDFQTKVASAKTTDVEQQLQQQFGMTIAEYKQQVVRPYLFQQKLQEAIAADPQVNQGLEQRAKQVADEVSKSKDSFDKLAAKYNEDPASSVQGGDMGVLRPGDAPKELIDAASKLKPGERSGLIKTTQGYHILELVESLPPEKDGTVVVHPRQILIAGKTIDQYMLEQLSSSRVAVFSRTLDWDPKEVHVVAS